MILVDNLRKSFFALSFLILFTSCSNKSQLSNLTGYTFGTYYDIKFFSESTNFNESDLDSIFQKFNSSLSTYISSSIISKINSNDEYFVDDLFIDVYNKSKVIYELTDGYFDPTVGLLLEYYGFGPPNNFDFKKYQFSEILGSVGFDKTRLNSDIIIKDNKLTKLDFNAIAKGYAVDIIASVMDKKNIDNYLIDIGGEIRSKGSNINKNEFWKVAINNPDLNSEDKYYRILNLNNLSIATSGNYRNYKIDSITKKKYVHVINPINGKSKQGKILSVSVLSKSCFQADAYATAMMLGDMEYAIDLTNRVEEIESFIIYVDSNNNINDYSSDGFMKNIINP
jgi:thiamine biosynthesis lipoprotein